MIANCFCMSESYGITDECLVMIVQENVATKNVHFCTLIQRRKLKCVHGMIEAFVDMVNICSVC